MFRPWWIFQNRKGNLRVMIKAMVNKSQVQVGSRAMFKTVVNKFKYAG